MEEPFWIREPTVLLRSFTLTPSRLMTEGQLLNTITRVVILVSLVLYLIGFRQWWLFLLLGLLMTIVIWCSSSFLGKSDRIRVEYYRCPAGDRPSARPTSDPDPACSSVIDHEREQAEDRYLTIPSGQANVPTSSGQGGKDKEKRKPRMRCRY